MPLRIALLVLLILSAVAAAAPIGAQTLPRFEDQVIVTAARAGSTVARVPAFVTLLDRDDIRSSAAHTIPDLLRQAGVQVTDITGNGRSFRVDLRGFGATAGSNTLVLVDGRRINQPDLGGSDWSQVPLDQVDRIEIIRGSGSAVAFGDNATGGAVNIVTRSGAAPAGSAAAPERESRAAVRTGAFSMLAVDGSSRGTRGNVSYSVSGGYGRSDGHRVNAATEGGDVAGRAVVRTSDAFELEMSGAFHHDRTGLPGALTETALGSGVARDDSVNPDDFAEVDDAYVMATPRLALGDRGRILVDVSLRQRDALAFSTFAGGEFSGDTGTRTAGFSPRLVWTAAAGGTTHQLVAGMDVSAAEEEIANTVVFGGVPDVGRFTLDKSGRAVFVRDEMTAGRATLSGGYRYDAASYTFAPSTPSGRDFRMHAADIGSVVRLTPGLSAFAGVSRSFRYPLLDELFDFFSNTILDTLGPQSSLDVEGGLRVESDVARASATVFHLVTDDEIFFNPAGGAFGFGANENLDGTSRRSGFEAAASVLVRGLEVGGSFAVVRASIDGGSYDGEAIPGVARRRATVLLRVPVSPRLSLGLDGSYTGSRRFDGDFAEEFGMQEGHIVADAKVTYRHGRARLFVDVRNLFDEEYSEYGVIGAFPAQRAIYPSPGVHAFAGIDVTF
jgi:iron complex outermembrane receptor protein